MNKATADSHDNPDFELDGNTLTVNTDLYWEYQNEFARYCQKLLDSEYKEIIIDISQIDFIFSAFVGYIVDFISRAVRAGKTPVLHISTNLRWLFDMLGRCDMARIEIVS